MTLTRQEFRELPLPDSKTKIKQAFRISEVVCMLGEASHSDVMARLEDMGDAVSSTLRATAKNYFNLAIEYGWLTKTGVTNGTKYVATARFAHHAAMRHLSNPVHLRPVQEYDQGFLDSYEPGRTFYLSAEQRRLLHRACPVGSFDTSATNRDHKMRRFMSDLSHHSASFEGVNAKLADTIKFLEEGIQSKELSVHDSMILRNHYSAIRHILNYCSYPPRENTIAIDPWDVRQLHAMVSDGLFSDPRSQGRLRTSSVGVRHSSYMPPENPDVIASTFEKMLKKAKSIPDPYEQALFLVIHIAYLQAFEDCNKRLGRILCNVPLLNAGIKPLSWSNVNDRDYVDALLCVYERRSTFGMCDLFTNACLRSFERFDQSNRDAPEAVLSVLWDREIRQAVREIVSGGVTPADLDLHDVPDQARESVRQIIAVQIDALKENELMAAGYGIGRSDYEAWRDETASSPSNS